MQTNIEQTIKNTSAGQEAERILRSCVHCGFCTATCPTYRLLGDELDSPRGRIYLIKSMLEGNPVTDNTLQHLDRCLTCRSCETTCPSGVEYGKLLDIGRHYADQKISRPWNEKLFRYLILKTLPYRDRFIFLLRIGQFFRFTFPASLKRLVPARKEINITEIKNSYSRKVILFTGCVQPALAPEINQSVLKVLDNFDISVIEIEDEQCCGALSQHLNAKAQALTFMRRNIDLFWSSIEQGAEAILITASGCGVHIKEYAYLLRDDKDYAEKAKKVSELAKDMSEFLQQFDLSNLNCEKKVAFQSPCTLQHGQKLTGVTENILRQLGFNLTQVNDAHLCCGSAGVFSLLQKELSTKLQSEKIDNLMHGQPEVILTANIGCLQHLQQVSPVPVKHWIEEVAELVD